jgi:cephalosporin hydroxylase
MIHVEQALDLPLRYVLAAIQDRIMTRTSYFGISTLKSPIDFWVYQEVLYETRPDFIIEIGNFCGGSTLALAHVCDHLGQGRVIGLDISHANVPTVVRAHPRISLVEGDACASYAQVAEQVPPQASVLVIEDSSHTFENTLKVLDVFSPLVKPGGYFIVEDGICHHGLAGGPCPGPYEAIESFIRSNSDFVVDRTREGFLITWNPKGYLKRVK